MSVRVKGSKSSYAKLYGVSHNVVVKKCESVTEAAEVTKDPDLNPTSPVSLGLETTNEVKSRGPKHVSEAPVDCVHEVDGLPCKRSSFGLTTEDENEVTERATKTTIDGKAKVHMGE